jgi:hypothetical protein
MLIAFLVLRDELLFTLIFISIIRIFTLFKELLYNESY